MNEKNKWKEFAIGQFFSDCDLTKAPALFDELLEVQIEEEFDAVLQKFNVAVWQPFEAMLYLSLVDAVHMCAHTAQYYADRGDE